MIGRKLNKIISKFNKRWLYNNYWTEMSSLPISYGLSISHKVIDLFDFTSILDAGCGSGQVVRYFLDKGYKAEGIELADHQIKKYAKDLMRLKIVRQGDLNNLPYKNSQFDIVFSTDVLEHIPEEEVPKVVSELVRVCRKHLFLTISLRPSSQNNAFHITLKSREWWEKQFLDCGVIKNNQSINLIQEVNLNLTNRKILELGPAKEIIEEMEWFIIQQPYSLNGELEPWFFIFDKE